MVSLLTVLARLYIVNILYVVLGLLLPDAGVAYRRAIGGGIGGPGGRPLNVTWFGYPS
jgi:hypothetical protein